MNALRPQQFQVLPPVVKNLIIINAIMLMLDYAMSKYGYNLSHLLGLHYWKSQYFKPWQLITHLFMHGNLGHLFFNMFALWMFGSTIENLWGGKRFLVFYLICGVGAALCHLTVLGFEFGTIQTAFEQFQNNPTIDQYQLFLQQHLHDDPPAIFHQVQMAWENDPGSIDMSNKATYLIQQYLHGGIEPSTGTPYPGMMDQATVGASGAVFGVLFAFGYLFPNVELYIYFLFPLKAKYFIAIYALIELYSGIQNSAGDNVAHFAHLGGMLFAYLILLYWRKQNIRLR